MYFSLQSLSANKIAPKNLKRILFLYVNFNINPNEINDNKTLDQARQINFISEHRPPHKYFMATTEWRSSTIAKA